MTQGTSIHIGLNRVDPASYGGWSGALAGCRNDATSMEEICRTQGFSTSILLDEQATSASVLAALRAGIGSSATGDLIVITYAGHGGQVPDFDGEEKDGQDETWVLYDRMMIDDELYALLATAPAGCGIVVISDSCHSGTIVRDGPPNYALAAVSGAMTATAVAVRAPRDVVSFDRVRPGAVRSIPPAIAKLAVAEHADLYRSVRRSIPRRRDIDGLTSAVVVLSGCQDNQTSLDGDEHGLFTQRLLDVWANASFTGDYGQLHAGILSEMPQEQTPQLGLLGPGASTLADTSALRLPSSLYLGPTGPTVAPVTTDRVIMPAQLNRNGQPPSVDVELMPGRWYELEIAAQSRHLKEDEAMAEAGHAATWMLSAQHLRQPSFTLPADWWNAVKHADQLWVALYSVSSSSGWTDRYQAAEPVWAPITDGRAREGELTVWAPESVYAGDGPPTLWIDGGLTPYYALEMAADPAMLDDETLRTSGQYAATWDQESWSFMSGGQQAVPREMWDALSHNDSLTIRAWGSSVEDDWVDQQSSEPVTMTVYQASGPDPGPDPNPKPSTAVLQPGDHVWYWNGNVSTDLDIPRQQWFPGSTSATDYLGNGKDIYNFVIHQDGEIRRGRPHMRGLEGSHAWLNKNAGNLTGVTGGMDVGQYRDKFNWHHFLIFPTEQAGYDAIAYFLRNAGYPASNSGSNVWPAGRYRDLSITEAFRRYAPAGDGANDPIRYGNDVAAAAGVSPSTLVGNLSNDQMRFMQDKIRQIEGAVAGVTLSKDSPDLPEEIRSLL